MLQCSISYGSMVSAMRTRNGDLPSACIPNNALGLIVLFIGLLSSHVFAARWRTAEPDRGQTSFADRSRRRLKDHVANACIVCSYADMHTIRDDHFQTGSSMMLYAFNSWIGKLHVSADPAMFVGTSIPIGNRFYA
jgi:hypothetical protein